jgi:hypothetical protein
MPVPEIYPVRRRRQTSDGVRVHKSAMAFARQYQALLGQWHHQMAFVSAMAIRGRGEVTAIERLCAEVEESLEDFRQARDALPDDIRRHTLLRDVEIAHLQLLDQTRPTGTRVAVSGDRPQTS